MPMFGHLSGNVMSLAVTIVVNYINFSTKPYSKVTFQLATQLSTQKRCFLSHVSRLE